MQVIFLPSNAERGTIENVKNHYEVGSSNTFSTSVSSLEGGNDMICPLKLLKDIHYNISHSLLKEEELI